jgi:hypothetical protein
MQLSILLVMTPCCLCWDAICSAAAAATTVPGKMLGLWGPITAFVTIGLVG